MRVTWHDFGRGPRILLDLGGEEWVFRVERAVALRDALTTAIVEAVARSPPMSDVDPDAHGGRYVEPFDRSKS